MKALKLLVPLCAALLLAGCGGGENDSASVPGGADSDSVKVIDSWADALRGGDIEAASEYFGVPSIVENGPPALRLNTRRSVRLFNSSLPCGAVLTKARKLGRYTLATFRLTDRSGPGGGCGQGIGQTAATAFVIRDGLIVEWRRAPTAGGSGGQSQGAPEGQVI